MARLMQIGFELNSSLEWTEAFDSPTIQTTTVRSGVYAGRVTSLTSATRKGWRIGFGANATRDQYVSFAVYTATRPSNTNYLCKLSGGTSSTAGIVVGITMGSAGAIQLRDEDGQIGSGTSALDLNAWYIIQIRVDTTPAAGSHVVEARYKKEGDSSWTSIASASNRNLSANIRQVMLGANLIGEGQTTGDFYFDDLIINDSSGSNQNSYPEAEKIIHLKPNATGNNNGFNTEAGAGGVNNYQKVDEVTPDDATTYVTTTTNTAIDDYNLDDSGLTSEQVVLVAVAARAQAVGASNGAIRLNVVDADGNTVSSSATVGLGNSVWNTYNTSANNVYPLVLYLDPDGDPWTPSVLDSLQLRLSAAVNVSGTNIRVTTAWVSVSYYVGSSSLIKSVNGLAKASVKSFNGLAIASIKSINGLA